MKGIFFEPPIESNHIGAILREVYGYIDKDGLFVRGIYSQFLQGKKDLTILDIGANIGLTSQYFSQFAKKVYSLEPAKEHFACFEKMVEFNGIKNIKPINKALWIEDTKKPLIHTKNKTMYSLHMVLMGSEQEDRQNPPEMVETTKLDTLVEQEGIKHIDFMKLDAEGTETEIFSSDSFEKVAPMIDTIVFETHMWDTRNPNQLMEALKLNNFKVQQLEADAHLFVATK